MQYFWPLYQTILSSTTLCLIFHIKLFDNLSMSDYFQLIEEEANLINLVRMYIEAENTRLNDLHKFQNLLIKNKELYANKDEFAWNPLAIYKSIKCLTVDLNKMKENMTTNNYDDVVLRIFPRHIDRLPNEDHLYEEVRRLTKMQRAQNLTTSDMMNGYMFDNVFVESDMTTQDCFCIGAIGASKDDHEMTTSWLPSCRNKFDDDTRQLISKMIILSALFIGDKSLAQTEIGNYLEIDSSDRIIIDLNTKLTQDSGNWTDAFLRRLASRKACAGDYENEGALRNLKCRYNHHNSLFLIIAPLKEEILSFQPKVSIFRDMIYDSEIDLMMNDAFNQLETATVMKKGVRVFELRYRVCQRAFLNTLWNRKYYNLRNRLSDMTSLSLKFSEKPQVLHYTPGGFYREHSDFLANCTDCSVTGNRVASTLMYVSVEFTEMTVLDDPTKFQHFLEITAGQTPWNLLDNYIPQLNDVALGGGTAFPILKLNVKPVKGSALFWMNMKVNETKEEMNDHAACPVIYGEKKAYTQWFRIKGQSHWISEPEDDAKAHYSFNPNVRCPRRDGKRDSSDSFSTY